MTGDGYDERHPKGNEPDPVYVSGTTHARWEEVAPGVQVLRGHIDPDAAVELMSARRQETRYTPTPQPVELTVRGGLRTRQGHLSRSIVQGWGHLLNITVTTPGQVWLTLWLQ